MKKIVTIVLAWLVLLSGIITFGVIQSNKDKESRSKAQVISSYQEDLEKNKNPKKLSESELKKKILLEDVGFFEGSPQYKDWGVDENNGVFVNAGVTSGDNLSFTSLIKENASLVRDKYDEETAKRLEEDFNNTKTELLEKQKDLKDPAKQTESFKQHLEEALKENK